MSREIKFRAWDKYNKDMCNVIGIEFDIEIVQLFGDDTYYPQEFKNVVFMQYTGLLDKEGVEIYEGDIIKLWFWNEGWDINDTSIHENRRVCFEDGCFRVKAIDRSGLCNMDMVGLEDCEVVGNIYENKKDK